MKRMTHSLVRWNELDVVFAGSKKCEFIANRQDDTCLPLFDRQGNFTAANQDHGVSLSLAICAVVSLRIESGDS